QCGECLRRLLVERVNLLPQLRELGLYDWVGQGINDRSVELFDDRLSSALWHPKPVPERNMITGKAALLNCRQFRSECQPLAVGYCKQLHGAVAAVWHGKTRIGHKDIDLPGDKVLHGWSRATIRHILKTNAGDVLQHQRKDVGDAARSSGCEGSSWVGLQPVQQPFEVVRWYRLPCRDHKRTSCHQRQRRKITYGVILKVWIGGAGNDMGTVLAETNRVAVRRRTCSSGNPENSSRTSDILNNDGLAECYPHPLGQQPCNQISGSTCGIRDDNRDGADWISLRPGRTRYGRDGGTCSNLEKSTARKVHDPTSPFQENAFSTPSVSAHCQPDARSKPMSQKRLNR